MTARPPSSEKLICTECGWPKVTRKAAWWGRPGWFACASVLCLGVAIIATGRSYTYTSGSPMAQFATPPVSALAAEVVLQEQAPDADARATDVVDALLAKSVPLDELAPGPVTLLVAFGAPEASFFEGWSFGWPTTWISGGATRVYADAIARTGEVAAATDGTRSPLGRNEWEPDVSRTPPRSLFDFYNSTLWVRPAPEQTNGVLREWRVQLLGLAVAFAMLIGVWVITRVVSRRVCAAGDSSQVRRTCLIATLIAFVVLLAVGVLTFQSGSQLGPPMWAKSVQRGAPPGPVYWTSENFADLGLSRQEVVRLRAEPGGSRRVVEAIMKVAPVMAEPERAYLAVQAHPGSSIPTAAGAKTWFSPPWLPILALSEYQYFTAAILGPQVPAQIPPGISLRWKRTGLQMTWDRGALPTRRAVIGIEPLALHVLAVFGLTALYGGALRAHRVMRRRRGLCPQCAYPLQSQREQASEPVVS